MSIHHLTESTALKVLKQLRPTISYDPKKGLLTVSDLSVGEPQIIKNALEVLGLQGVVIEGNYVKDSDFSRRAPATIQFLDRLRKAEIPYETLGATQGAAR